ncbi:hypothetical protein PPERSA_02203 [Pseudocohnilembus persalinus]|uniref:Papain family cysteine protease n=1 Tax=Pseudocohnilembus persalinus TaxID=266149 RepID=A0A0V0R0J8_PSEPJ|nr:hypothetical protein PPERSA_02203 [Pseudocohnilembus persalinus]|eukprot:KRX08071.1 hypothetical protein PPERSA_02203 [Pseudocohnilembus persalinus]
MKNQLLLITLLALSTVYLYSQNGNNYSEVNEFQSIYDQWKLQYGINFEKSQDFYRLIQFIENYKKIQEFNAQNDGLKLKINQFGALSNEEYVQMYLNNNRQQVKSNRITKKTTSIKADLPNEVDWNKKGAVLPTRNQGSCGSCWAFSTVGGLQSLMYIVKGQNEYLSVQQVTSCVPAEYLDNKVEGCGGGLPLYAYQYTAQYGIESEENYPYSNFNGGVADKCKYEKSKVVFQNQGIGEVAQKDVEGMKQNLVNQPLSIGIDASSIAFQFYSSGVIAAKNCGTSINHSILLTGYKTDAHIPYWIVQNSWGQSWGMNGFGYMEMTEGEGTCAINMEVNFPTSVDQ